jgi:hypothetical protein
VSTTNADRLKHAHLILTVLWFAMVPVAIATGWIGSLVFISACSIYANAAAHFGAWQASRAETDEG